MTVESKLSISVSFTKASLCLTLRRKALGHGLILIQVLTNDWPFIRVHCQSTGRLAEIVPVKGPRNFPQLSLSVPTICCISNCSCTFSELRPH
jgi:hypothetical protein